MSAQPLPRYLTHPSSRPNETEAERTVRLLRFSERQSARATLRAERKAAGLCPHDGHPAAVGFLGLCEGCRLDAEGRSRDFESGGDESPEEGA